MGFRFCSLEGKRKTTRKKNVQERRKEKPPWVKGQESMALRATRELRAAQKEHSK